MPLYASAFFVPTSAGVPYILEDVYLRGGYRSVATIADRDAIKSAARKQGAIVYVREDTTLYWLPDTVVAGADAWKPFDVTRYVNFVWDAPLSLDTETEPGKFHVKIEGKRIVPVILEEHAGFVLIAGEGGNPVWAKLDALPNRDAAAAGHALILDAQKNPIWGAVSSLPSTEGVAQGSALVVDSEGDAVWGEAAKKARITPEHSPGPIIAAGTAQFELALNSQFGAVLRLAVSHPDLVVELHRAETFDDTNPYTFISSVAKLEDDGITVLEGGEIQKSRRYGFFEAAAAVEPKMYVKITNEGQDSVEPTLYLTFLPME